MYTLCLISCMINLMNNASESELPRLIRQYVISPQRVGSHTQVAKTSDNMINIADLGMSESDDNNGEIKANRVANVLRLNKRYEVGARDGEKGIYVSELSHVGYNQLLSPARAFFEVLYDTDSKMVLASSENGIVVIDPRNDKTMKDIILGMRPSQFKIVNEGKRVYASLTDEPTVLVIDMATGETVRKARLRSGFRVSAMAAVESAEQLLVADGETGEIAVVDAENGCVSETLKACAKVGGLFYDTTLKRAFAVCGTGFINMFCKNGTGWSHCGSIATRPGANVAQYTQEGQKLYLVVPGVSKSAIWVYDTSLCK